MKVLLLGKTGLLGTALLPVLQSFYRVDAPMHSECDMENPANLTEYIKKCRPDIVINATGYTDVDKAETEKEKAFGLNAGAVDNLINAIQDKIPMLHFSTDYVFDGEKSGGYNETDSPSKFPLSAYGASKAAAERLITQKLSKYYIVRTAWLYGDGGRRNFVDTMLNLAGAGEPLRVVDDQIGNPTYTCDTAHAVFALLKTKPYGIYHIVNDGFCSWWEFAKEIFNQLGIPKDIIPIKSEELKRPAKRPKISILNNSKLPKLRNWKQALEDYLTNKQLIT